MKRQASYADSHVNPYVASHMPHMPAQIMQPNAALNNFPGNLNPLSTEEEYRYKSSKVEGQWQRDRDAPNVVNHTSSLSFIEGQGDSGTRSYYQGQMPDQKRGSDNQSNGETRSLPHEQDMEIGYEDKPSSLTFEALEQKFLDEIINLAKEQNDAEAVENERHREKIIELNTKYQEKILALHSQQAARREEFLRKESQARLNQYQQAGMNHHLNTGIRDTHGTPEEFLRKESQARLNQSQQAGLNHYPNTGMHDTHGTPVAAAAEAHQAYAASQFESYRERQHMLGSGRTQGTERVPYPSGRVYNNASRHY